MTLLERIKNEPALVSGFVNAALLCSLAFGFQLSEEQIAAVMVMVNAALALFVRSQVTPTNKTDERGAIDVGTAIVIVFLGLVLLALLGFLR